MTVINLNSMTAVMDRPAKSAKLGLPGNADQVAFAISIALGRVRCTVQNKRRLQRNADDQIAKSVLKCTEGADAIILRVIHCPLATIA